jgi:hemolysin activation/secretion protein
MRASLLLFCALLSAGLLPGPADARPRSREERQEQRQEQREAREERARQQRQAQQEPREQRQERPEVMAPGGLRDGRSDRGDRSGEAARRAQQQNGGGRVLSVDPDGGGYRVKVLKDGEVRTHHVVVED